MAQDSKIEWTKHTQNLWSGCTKVTNGCTNCYAETLSKRFGNDVWGEDKPRLIVKSAWSSLVKFQKLAKESNEIHYVFVGSMMDIFEKPMPLIDSKGGTIEENTNDLRQHFFKNIDSAPNLMFLLLTKRPSNIPKYVPTEWNIITPKNIMYGTSLCEQKDVINMAEKLVLYTPDSAKRFLSIEPQIGNIEIPINLLKRFDWVIQGGESGHHKRPFDLSWAYSMKKQCEEAGVPYFFKQIDKIQEIPIDLQIRQFPKI